MKRLSGKSRALISGALSLLSLGVGLYIGEEHRPRACYQDYCEYRTINQQERPQENVYRNDESVPRGLSILPGDTVFEADFYNPHVQMVNGHYVFSGTDTRTRQPFQVYMRESPQSTSEHAMMRLSLDRVIQNSQVARRD